MTSASLQNTNGPTPPWRYHGRMRPWYVVAKQLAADKRISYQEMADLLHVAKATVGHWLTGRNRATIDVIKEIARVLDVPVTELIAEDAYYLTDENERRLIDKYRKIAPELRKHAPSILEGLIDQRATDQPPAKN